MPTNLLPIKTTKLSPELEAMYKTWVMQNQVPQSNNYDMRGFYLGGLLGDPAATSGVDPSDLQLHFTDKWKLPNHPRFSEESMYSRSTDDPYWMENPAPYVEGTWARIDPRKGLLNVDLPFGY
jgi:hypothetical protein